MRAWHLGTLIFFGYVAGIAMLRRGLPPRRRARALAATAGGAMLTLVSLFGSADGLLAVWIVPIALLLIAYWASGFLFVAPMSAAEAILARIDAALRIDRASARMPRMVAELLELAYTGVYPLIPLALFLARRSNVSVERFWTIVVFTDLICFAMLPWIQTRPPRAVMGVQPWRTSWRRMNRRILDAGSIGVNTFPSGHAAEALAAALLLSGSAWPIAACMFAIAAAISAGAVLGRYHYAADALAGWAVAILVWALVNHA
ncbi:MAG TPA: phosphatase PAP2 family protein [Vicinamibacterales bacterium]|nr:phosphatase PAP2 family protein [Vicinamibacterales bacterium]